MKKIGRILIFVAAGVILLCLVVVIVSTLSNLGLPTELSVVDRLNNLEKARLGEAFHLRTELGEAVWPGWGKADIPVIVYNADYAFLVGMENPEPGWKKVPARQERGGPWEEVPGETIQGHIYYRQRLVDPNITPEAFTVLVGNPQGRERWVATFQTRDYAQISLIQGFRESMPGPLKPILPYRLLWKLLMGNTETYIGVLAHESFHAYQGIAAPERLAESENAMQYNSQYPWEDTTLEAAWQAELDKLYEATQARGNEQIAQRARQFLALRDERRKKGALPAGLIAFERQREWEEGLAKYAELEIQRQAALSKIYKPLPDIRKDPDFNSYTDRLRFWNNQLSEVKRLSNREGETRFYYSGFAQAALLDRLMPGWKEQAFLPGIWLEDLLRQAAQ